MKGNRQDERKKKKGDTVSHSPFARTPSTASPTPKQNIPLLNEPLITQIKSFMIRPSHYSLDPADPLFSVPMPYRPIFVSVSQHLQLILLALSCFSTLVY